MQDNKSLLKKRKCDENSNLGNDRCRKVSRPVAAANIAQTVENGLVNAVKGGNGKYGPNHGEARRLVEEGLADARAGFFKKG